mmetsp:Transcript_20086/g.41714  ORF Transcript_20086/g.41714 Transcript_20086/m.41714 type:complete len:778 (+) Transcript_20086:103-2436(+)
MMSLRSSPDRINSRGFQLHTNLTTHRRDSTADDNGFGFLERMRAFQADSYDKSRKRNIRYSLATPRSGLSCINYFNQRIFTLGGLLIIAIFSCSSLLGQNRKLVKRIGFHQTNINDGLLRNNKKVLIGNDEMQMNSGGSSGNHTRRFRQVMQNELTSKKYSTITGRNFDGESSSSISNANNNTSSFSQATEQNRSRIHHALNPFALLPGDLPGYTGWARPEQTLAGYFDIERSSHPGPIARDIPSSSTQQYTKYHSVVKSEDKFSLLITCNNDKILDSNRESLVEPPYLCPEEGGSLFYLRAYGPSVISGNIIDHHNRSYSVEMYPVDPGEYTVELVVTFSSPLNFDDLPINRAKSVAKTQSSLEYENEEEVEPGFEGYMVAGFPLLIWVDPLFPGKSSKQGSVDEKPLCNITQLTDSSPLSSLSKGHWQVIDHVARSSHQPLTPDESGVTLDGYRMGLNSVGVRMQYSFEDCELLRIRDIFDGMTDGTGHIFERCLDNLNYDRSNITNFSRYDFDIEKQNNGTVGLDLAIGRRVDSFNGIHIIFIGDSVMKLEMGFFTKLVTDPRSRSIFQGLKISFLETNGGIHATMANVTSKLNAILENEGNQSKKVILFNTGLHDVDILCSSIRSRSRGSKEEINDTKACVDLYREALEDLTRVIDAYPAQIKIFRSTTAGWQKYGNYGFSWPATSIQPLSRSPHVVHYFNEIAYSTIQKCCSTISIADGYWITLPRPDHTQTSDTNQIGKHLVHPGYEILSVFARRWLMTIICGLCSGVLAE